MDNNDKGYFPRDAYGVTQTSESISQTGMGGFFQMNWSVREVSLGVKALLVRKWSVSRVMQCQVLSRLGEVLP